MSHPKVRHRDEYLHRYVSEPTHWFDRWNSNLCAWLAHHLLASKLMFDLALFLPVATIGSTALAYKVLIFSNWIQWWALPALQRTGNEITARQDAQADAAHDILTHLAVLQDEQIDILHAIKRRWL